MPEEGTGLLPVEIELRARFDEATHGRLVARLEQEGTDLGCDDKNIFFYVLPDKLLKVTDNTAAGSAKITLKHSKIGQGVAFPETEIAIAREDIPAAVRVFNALGFESHMHQAFNQRHNYRFRGVEIAVKWSEAWGHHAEFEVLLDDNASDVAVQEATDRIFTVAKELEVTLMTEQELADFTAAFETAEQSRKTGPVEIERQT
jgi:adenylate cyclase class IV